MSGMSLTQTNGYLGKQKINSQLAGTEASSQVEALQILAQMLLQEIESIKQAVPANSERREIDLTEEVERFETNLIRRALILAKGKQCEAARLLKIKNNTLNAKIKRYGIKFCKTEYIEEITGSY